jgi:hypothetical protein
MRYARFAALAAAAALAALAAPAAAEPPDPVVIGWWSYFTPEGAQYQVPTNDPAHPITMYGDPNVYFYEPSGGQGLQGTAPPEGPCSRSQARPSPGARGLAARSRARRPLAGSR